MKSPLDDIFLSLPSASASRTYTPRILPAVTRVYTPSPLDKRNLKVHGDPFEREAYQQISKFFPSYENLWTLLVWDITDRDFSIRDGQPRKECPQALGRFAEAHYTFFRSLMYCSKLLGNKHLGEGHDLEPYFSNERFLSFYSHLGRIRDMCCLMIEQFELSINGEGEFRKGKSKEFDYSLIAPYLNQKAGNQTGDHFQSWNSEIGHYRNLLHRTAHAVLYRNGEWQVLKPGFLKDSGGWVETLNRKQSDFIPVEEIMQKHWTEHLRWAEPLWGYFIKQVQGWRKETGKFNKLLNLPT